MRLKVNCTKKYFIGRIICLILTAASSACVARDVEELTFTSPYASIVGTEYRIVAEVNAYGIYKNQDKKEVPYITLIPGVGIAGPEIAFKRRIAKGQNIKILSAWRERKLLHSDIYYLIGLHDADLPRDIQIRLELSSGNEDGNAGLNPRIYEKVGKELKELRN